MQYIDWTNVGFDEKNWDFFEDHYYFRCSNINVVLRRRRSFDLLLHHFYSHPFMLKIMKEIANGLKQQLSLSGSYIYLTYKFHGKLSIERFKRKTSVVRAVHGKVGSSYAWFVVILQLVYTLYIDHTCQRKRETSLKTDDSDYLQFQEHITC